MKNYVLKTFYHFFTYPFFSQDYIQTLNPTLLKALHMLGQHLQSYKIFFFFARMCIKKGFFCYITISLFQPYIFSTIDQFHFYNQIFSNTIYLYFFFLLLHLSIFSYKRPTFFQFFSAAFVSFDIFLLSWQVCKKLIFSLKSILICKMEKFFFFFYIFPKKR